MKTVIRYIVKKLVIILYRIMCVVIPVNKKRIVFDSSLGKSYSGNPRHIFEYMVENGYQEKWECTWFYENEPYPIPGDGYQFRYGRFRYLYYMATAKVWVFDCRQPEWLIKRKGCYYIQTWHGTPLKKLVLDMEDVFMVNETDIESYQKGFVKNVQSWDYLLSQNPFSTVTFRRAFDYNKCMLEIGYPRNDILYSEIRPANKRFAYVSENNVDNYIASTKLMVLRAKEGVNPKFVYNLLKSQQVIDELQHLAETRSGTFPQITFSSELAPMQVNLPDTLTQNKIVGILEAIECKIELNTQINNNLAY